MEAVDLVLEEESLGITTTEIVIKGKDNKRQQ